VYVSPPAERLPWGETYAECAQAALDDPDAPPFLVLAAWKFLHGYGERAFRSLLADALALPESEIAS
jgi:hypothetical protein